MDINLSKPLLIVGTIVGAIVGLALLSAFLPTLFDSTAAITENVTDGDVGNDQANGILHVFAFIVPLAIVVGIVGLILFVARLK